MTEPHLTFWDFIDYVQRNWGMLLGYLYQHIVMVLTGVGLAFLVGVPLGAICTRNRALARIILAVMNVLQVVPSLAMLVLLLLIMGLGSTTVVVGLFLYSLNPIVRNTYIGLQQINPSYVEAGRGVGMSTMQILFQIRFPLALTYIMTGLRISAVIAIGVATIAPLVGGSGLGREIYAGINNGNSLRIFAGAVPAALLAIVADIVLGTLQRMLKPDRKRSRNVLPPTPKAQG
ncbi:ABC transporter permease [Paenibacillus rhizovicinus]|uniref:ABC transporter permease n=1 Tax=Paenibacillus rhizovicinus TaxID=2704463 RepID=A0A6C0P8P7_9BACL|nr:ABC transporter permease [Paenibacillus rhizovicinus]QHW34755.1 ABC transporter permease [Paenibacillus rhizovicinus]